MTKSRIRTLRFVFELELEYDKVRMSEYNEQLEFDEIVMNHAWPRLTGAANEVTGYWATEPSMKVKVKQQGLTIE